MIYTHEHTTHYAQKCALTPHGSSARAHARNTHAHTRTNTHIRLTMTFSLKPLGYTWQKRLFEINYPYVKV